MTGGEKDSKKRRKKETQRQKDKETKPEKARGRFLHAAH